MNRIFVIVLSFFLCSSLKAGDIYVEKFNNILKSKSVVNNLSRIKELSNRGSSIDFMHISYVLSALNNMYLATNDVTYLKLNEEIVDDILSTSSQNGGKHVWIAKSNKERFSIVDGQEVILYEGYLAKYFAEFLYMSKDVSLPHYSRQLQALEAVFLKWYERSMKEFGDPSRLYGVRTHIGAQWATTALYLAKITENLEIREIADDFHKTFSASLKRNLQVKRKSGNEMYVWNSTWDYPFTKLQKERKESGKDKAQAQDVSHGNHVIQFVLASYDMGTNEWKRSDILRFCNTYKYNIYKGKKKFNDNVDGSGSIDASLKGTGWKVSDAWMKLALYDSSLIPLFDEYYTSNQKYIDNSYLNLQFASVFALIK